MEPEAFGAYAERRSDVQFTGMIGRPGTPGAVSTMKIRSIVFNQPQSKRSTREQRTR